MVSQSEFLVNLRLAESVKQTPGCVVECGVWRGGMSAGIGTVLGPDRTYLLFDSFQGLPQAQQIDGERAIEWQRNTNSPIYYDNCSASPEFAHRAMALAGVKSYRLIEGWFNETLPSFRLPEKIALLRLDADWYESTMICLETFFDHVVSGGLIILDDYYAWDGCSRALHDFLSRRSALEKVRSLDEVCFIRKGSK
jgi:O-methyltransferase